MTRMFPDEFFLLILKIILSFYRLISWRDGWKGLWSCLYEWSRMDLQCLLSLALWPGRLKGSQLTFIFFAVKWKEKLIIAQLTFTFNLATSPGDNSTQAKYKTAEQNNGFNLDITRICWRKRQNDFYYLSMITLT